MSDNLSPSRPYVVMTSSASGIGPNRHVAVVETDGITMPCKISDRAKGARRIVRGWWRRYAGTTDQCQYARAMRAATTLAEHLNMMHQVRRGNRSITLRNIDEQANAELQRELIDAYGGLDRYLADAGAGTAHEDETGRLVRRAAGEEPIVAVQVVCPTTGRQYMLRVPPETKTAREGVAWTFGLPAELYQPTIQS